ncbi:MAG TPA: hypothetical protein VL401_01010 [Alphaproteobacteria bacterium]|jgi:hypothetical protein|nr:hypothetical protein [Alphaproteobacteria bacterium]
MDSETQGINKDGADQSKIISSPISQPATEGLSQIGKSAMSGEAPVESPKPYTLPDGSEPFKFDWEKAKVTLAVVQEPENKTEERIVLPRTKFPTPILTEAAKGIPGEVITYGQMKEVAWPENANFIEAYAAVQRNAIGAPRLIMNGSFISNPLGELASTIIPPQVEKQVPDNPPTHFTGVLNININLGGLLNLGMVAQVQNEVHKYVQKEDYTAGGAATFAIKLNGQPCGIFGTGVNLQDGKPVEYGILTAGNMLSAKKGVGFKQLVS